MKRKETANIMKRRFLTAACLSGLVLSAHAIPYKDIDLIETQGIELNGQAHTVTDNVNTPKTNGKSGDVAGFNSLTKVVTADSIGPPRAVPDGGMTVALLGLALVGLGSLARPKA
jgi:hypothetical protein